jgi:hypothetical protein
MSATRHDRLVHELNGTSEGFIRSLEGVPDSRWSFTPSPDTWSVAQTAEHTTAVFRNIQKLVTTRLTERPLPPGTRSPITDDIIVKTMFDRGKRYESPPFVVPKGRWTNPGELITAFSTARQDLLVWLDETTIDLRGYTADHVRFGAMDGVQWLLFAAAHTERHTRQILELRQANGF